MSTNGRGRTDDGTASRPRSRDDGCRSLSFDVASAGERGSRSHPRRRSLQTSTGVVRLRSLGALQTRALALYGGARHDPPEGGGAEAAPLEGGRNLDQLQPD